MITFIGKRKGTVMNEIDRIELIKEDYATEPVITVQLEESADFVAVFEEESGR